MLPALACTFISTSEAFTILRESANMTVAKYLSVRS